MKFLLDTNILSEPLAALPDPGVMGMIKAHSADVAICVVTWQELLYGMHLLAPGKRRDRIQEYLYETVEAVVPILPFDRDAARWQAEQRARLRRIGRTASYADSQIAAIAAVNRLVLVTRNSADFADFDGLSVENWFQTG